MLACTGARPPHPVQVYMATFPLATMTATASGSNLPHLKSSSHRSPRTLDLCFDGTGSKFRHTRALLLTLDISLAQNTNIVRFFSVPKKGPWNQSCAITRKVLGRS
jgi:hypothetical protein